MDVSPVRLTGVPRQLSPLGSTPARVPGLRAASGDSGRTPVAAPEANASIAAHDVARLDVQVQVRDGRDLLTIVDSVTGQVYCELPPEEMVRFLDAILTRARLKESGHA